MEPLGHHLWVGFIGGLLSFAHCLGMCGGFFLHLSLDRDDIRTISRQIPWLIGKLFSYLFLGAAAGHAGAFLGGILLRQGLFLNVLSFAAGALILFMGLSVLGLVPVRIKAFYGLGESVVASLGGSVLTGRSGGGALVLGMICGFLPCPIVLAFLAYALQSGSVASGMATMGALGVGTMVPMLVMGGAARLCGIHLRSWAPKAGGIILIALGLTTSLRGTEFFHRLLGCPSQHRAVSDPSRQCCPGEHGTGYAR